MDINQLIKVPPVFNPFADDSKVNRRILTGETTNLQNLNEISFNWAQNLYTQMRDYFWVPEKLDLTQDVVDYKNLTKEEQRAYKGIQSYLTYLDSIQTVNLPEFNRYVTAPELKQNLTMQLFQESIHNQSYQYMFATILPVEEIGDTYYFWREDKVLLDRCEYIASFYQRMWDEPSYKNYFDALIADYLLEGLYFYIGFIYFYNLSSRQLMSGTANIFQMINRDELQHVRNFQKIINEIKVEIPECYSEERIYEITSEAVEKELLWTNHIIGNDILGMPEQTNEQYIKYRADLILRGLGLNPIYNQTINPYKHLEDFSDTEDKASVKPNFFEATSTGYIQSSGVDGWDF